MRMSHCLCLALHAGQSHGVWGCSVRFFLAATRVSLTPVSCAAMTSSTATQHTLTSHHNKYARVTEKKAFAFGFSSVTIASTAKILLATSQFVQLELSPKPAPSTIFGAGLSRAIGWKQLSRCHLICSTTPESPPIFGC